MKYTILGLVAINLVLLLCIIGYTNKAQSTCVAIGDIGPGELSRISFSFSNPDYRNLKESMIETHAVVGTNLLLSTMLFLVSTTLIVIVSVIQKNQNPDKTIE